MLEKIDQLSTKLTALAQSSSAGLLIVGGVLSIVLVWVVYKACTAANGFFQFLLPRSWHPEERAKRRDALRRRVQFFKILDSDIAAISKTESWNDQHFTDLEAEVEVEGQYFASWFRRFVNRTSEGLRREASLMRAIDRSSESRLMLIGDPGAGKSVALRHLAVELLARGQSSGRERATVPLYVNLRELKLPRNASPTAEAIRQFVIDNVRRNDADTAEYLNENWKALRASGSLFFLFDSFDEIPDVLHSAAGDKKVSQYSAAIQEFLYGMPGCRSIIASREFKCPTGIDWPRLKILPLNEERQEELIERTYLTRDQKKTAQRHAALSQTSTFSNPLFLALLCRYIRRQNRVPENEHDLLFDHVQSLTGRDAEYVRRTWSLDAEDLLTGAAGLARVFAVNAELGLSPTVDEIANAVTSTDDFPIALPAVGYLLEALTYVKVCRTDVASSDPSIRRVAFAHRRYQECLFAKYLVEHPQTISIDELVSDRRWREYVVALLQLGDAAVTAGLISSMAMKLRGLVSRVSVQRRKFFKFEVTSYDWSDPALVHLLSLAQEAMRFRSRLDFAAIEPEVDRLVSQLWKRGDLFDRLQVVRLCNAGNPDRIGARMDFAAQSRLGLLEAAALKACKYVTNPSQILAGWSRSVVSMRMAMSRRRSELLRWEALGAELPPAYGLARPMVRARKIFSTAFLFRPFARIFEYVDRAVPDPAGIGPPSTSPKIAVMNFGAAVCIFLTIPTAVIAVVGMVNATSSFSFVLVGLASVACIVGVVTLFRLIFLAEPARPSLVRVARAVVEALRELRGQWLGVGAVMLLFFAPGLVFWAANWALGHLIDLPATGIPVASGVFYLTLGAALGFREARKLRGQRKAAIALLDRGVSAVSMLRKATTAHDLAAVRQWIETRPISTQQLREVLALLSVGVTSEKHVAWSPPWRRRSPWPEAMLANSALAQLDARYEFGA